MPNHILWFLLTWSCVLWYACLILYVGWKGFKDIRQLLAALKKSSTPGAANE